MRPICFAALVSIGFASLVSRPLTSEEPMSLSDPLAQIGDTTGIEAQMVISGRTLVINADAFNALREKAIARDTEELLQLALELKDEIDRSSDEGLSANALAKANQIEKLARDVKSRMTIDPSRVLL
jgi:hypothetical protein